MLMRNETAFQNPSARDIGEWRNPRRTEAPEDPFVSGNLSNVTTA